MHEEPHLDPLRRIQKVSAPPFLFTRIEAKIQRQEEEKVPVKWVWIGATAFSLLLALNLFLVTTNSNSENTTTGLEYVITDMGLNTSNQLYDE